MNFLIDFFCLCFFSFTIFDFLRIKKNLLIFFISLLYDFHIFQHTSLLSNFFSFTEYSFNILNNITLYNDCSNSLNI